MVLQGKESEAATVRELQPPINRIVDSPLPSDFGQRTLTYRLAGMSNEDPDSIVSWLVSAARFESSPRAFGSALSAAVVLLAQFRLDRPAIVEEIRALVASDVSGVARLRLASAANDFVGHGYDVNRREIEALLQQDLPVESSSEMWSSELLRPLASDMKLCCACVSICRWVPVNRLT